ncbi:MAG: energy-coupling factor transporter transmembrane component T [Anaerolineae bacterium]|jgi:energy-coupling factor transport system permease protein|nr:energy-coupling factor transporter transmembrane protein EcfT [Chloroflexota bacterium]
MSNQPVCWPATRNTTAWLVWVLATAALALTIRNPLYITLIVLATWLVHVQVARNTPAAANWSGLVRLGLTIWLIAIPFSALMNHQGETVLFRLPESWPLLGGPITAESVAAGAASGYSLWALLLVFATFNLAVDAAVMIQAMPAFLSQAGVITTIALTFIPRMVQDTREIREAQRIRGHRFRSWRDSVPLAMPLLTTAFEHAIQLAESIESRGLSARTMDLSARRTRLVRGALALALLALLAGLVVRLVGPPLLGNALVAGAALVLMGAFYDLERHARRTRFVHQVWTRADKAIVAISVGALAVGLGTAWARPDLTGYAPVDAASLLPAFSLVPGIAVTLLALPGLLGALGANTAPTGSEAPQ